MKFCVDVIAMICALYECESNAEFVELWNSFCSLHEHHLISEDDWGIFFPYADPLYFDDQLNRVVRELPF